MVRKIKVLIVDDSAIVRAVFQRELAKDPAIEIIGTAADAYIARDKIIKLEPDVLTLDVEMPRMDGVTFLRKLMSSRPMPVIMVSAFTPQGCSLSLEALEAGALDVIEKPAGNDEATMTAFRTRLLALIKSSARVRRSVPKSSATESTTPLSAPTYRPTKSTVVAMGASTGGTEALRSVLRAMPLNCPGIVIVQHMPENFTGPFAARLNQQCLIEVLEATDGMVVQPGRAILARGSHHLIVQKRGAGFCVRAEEGELVSRHRPSVDVLFESVAKQVKGNAVGIIMTGMGRDGAAGMKSMRDAGAATIAQDEDSCIVFGMPKEAIALGGVESVVSLEKIPEKTLSILRKM